MDVLPRNTRVTMYQKPFLSFQEQIELLKHRGLHISDPLQAHADLAHIGYYRLSAYWYAFRHRLPGHREGIDMPSDTFRPGYDIQDAISLYTFDRQLRLILLDAIERIEVAVRVQVAYQMGTHGAFAYLDRSVLGKDCDAASRINPSISQYDEFMGRLNTAIRDSREAFAAHYRAKYNGKVPIWVAIELWDFGMLSRFFQFLDIADRERVAAQFGLDRHKTLVSWLEALNLLRNICAHHGRLFKRQLVNAPKIPKSRDLTDFHHLRRLEDRKRTQLYPLLCVTAFLMRFAAPTSAWSLRIVEHFTMFPEVPGIGPKDYGFPDTWFDEAFWSPR